MQALAPAGLFEHFDMVSGSFHPSYSSQHDVVSVVVLVKTTSSYPV